MKALGLIGAILLSASIVGGQEPDSASLCETEIHRSNGTRALTDRSQLAVPWPRVSHVKQPWRGYLETVPTSRLLEGLGIHWGADVPGAVEEMAVSLARSGFRRVRLEIPWGALRWDETRFEPAFEARIITILRALRTQGIRPLLLLNAHHMAPGPVRNVTVRVAEAATAGARTIRIEGDLSQLEASKAQLADFVDAVRPGPLVTGIAADRGELSLSRPITRALAAGDELHITQLKYAPLHPVGTPRFRESLAGWARYVEIAATLASAAFGSEDYEIEVWNELTFGYAFLDVGFYGEPPRLTAGAPDFLRRGGTAWELANETAKVLAQTHPQVRLIWGLSNTTFFHTPVNELPRGYSGQSYHPYGTERRCYPESHLATEKTVDGFVPKYCVAMPEGWAHTFLKTESLLRLLDPVARRKQSTGGDAPFDHYITEHGVHPPTLAGGGDELAIARGKAKFLLRAPLFWLHKGIRAFYAFQAYDPAHDGMGFLGSTKAPSPSAAALTRLVAAFGESRPVDDPDRLSVEVGALSVPSKIFEAPPGRRSLDDLDVATVLPFQSDSRRFVVAAYVMTRDFPEDHPPSLYEIRLGALPLGQRRVRYYDPLNDSQEPVAVCASKGDSLRVRIALTDTPRLLIIDEP